MGFKTHCPRCRLWNRRVPSADADTTRSSFGQTAIATTASSWPYSTCRGASLNGSPEPPRERAHPLPEHESAFCLFGKNLVLKFRTPALPTISPSMPFNVQLVLLKASTLNGQLRNLRLEDKQLNRRIANKNTQYLRGCRGLDLDPAVVSQMTSVVSRDPETSAEPSAAAAMQVTRSTCPRTLWSSLPSSTCPRMNLVNYIFTSFRCVRYKLEECNSRARWIFWTR